MSLWGCRAGRYQLGAMAVLPTRYGSASARFREPIAASTCHLANEVVPWNDMRAFLARQGIALDKQRCVCPIEIGKCCQQMEAKEMALVTGPDVQDTCDSDQLCSGAKARAEAGVDPRGRIGGPFPPSPPLPTILNFECKPSSHTTVIIRQYYIHHTHQRCMR